MRITILALMLGLGLPAAAAEITGGLAMGCSDPEWYARVSRMMRAGDRDAAVRFIEQSAADGSCKRWPAGLQVRIEEVRFPLVCVAPMGSTEACRWLESREVKR